MRNDDNHSAAVSAGTGGAGAGAGGGKDTGEDGLPEGRKVR